MKHLNVITSLSFHSAEHDIDTASSKINTKSIHGSIQWYYNERNSVSNHRRLECLLNQLFRRRSKKASKHCVTGLREGNQPVTGRLPSQRDSTRKMFPFNDVICVIDVWKPIPIIFFSHGQLIQSNIKDNIRGPHYWPLCSGNPQVTTYR